MTTEAEGYVRLARAVIATFPRSKYGLRMWWKDEEESRKLYRLDQRQIDALIYLCKAKSQSLPEFADDEEREEHAKRVEESQRRS